MITDAIHDYVAGQLSGLWSLPKPQRRARLAELRRGVGHQPGDPPAPRGGGRFMRAAGCDLPKNRGRSAMTERPLFLI